MHLDSYMRTVLLDRPRLYESGWRISNGATGHADYTGQNVNANEAGTLPVPAPGPFGGISSDFPTSGSSRIEYSDSSFLDVADVFSCEAWYYLTTTGGAQSLISKGNGEYQLLIGATELITLNREATVVLATSSKALVLNTWTHCVATKSGSTIRVYYNGADDTVAGTNSTCTDGNDVLRIGSRSGGLGEHQASGWIAHAAVYNYALSPAQVLKHYHAGMYGGKR